MYVACLETLASQKILYLLHVAKVYNDKKCNNKREINKQEDENSEI
jgi:hypothetical protein